MTVKQWLGRARFIDREIEMLREEKLTAKDRLTKITQSYEGDIGGSGTRDPHRFDAYVSYDSMIDQKTQELYDVKEEITGMIMRLTDRRERMCLFYYYIRMLTLEEIAVRMYYSFRQTKRFHRAGCTHVGEMLDLPVGEKGGGQNGRVENGTGIP